MTTIRLHQHTSVTPEQFVAAITDFGPGREKIFGNSAEADLRVHARGATYADVTEGSGGIWERLSYDWSNVRRVTMATTDSNVWGGASGHTYTLTPLTEGGTDIDVVVVRDGKNLKGHVLGFLFRFVGGSFLGKALASTVTAVEARVRA
jgi:hypothetical protein